MVRVRPWRSSVPLKTVSTLAPEPWTLSVAGPTRVMIALLVYGSASVPTWKAPRTAIQSAVRLRSFRSNSRVPSMVRLRSVGGETSSTIVRPAGTVTSAPAPGTTPPDQAAGSDQRATAGGGGGGGGGATASSVEQAVARTLNRTKPPKSHGRLNIGTTPRRDVIAWPRGTNRATRRPDRTLQPGRSGPSRPGLRCNFAHPYWATGLTAGRGGSGAGGGVHQAYSTMRDRFTVIICHPPKRILRS